MADARTDDARRVAGYLSVSETLALAAQGVAVLDPNSTLVSPGVVIGRGTILYPNTILFCDSESSLSVGNDNVIWPGALFSASAGGRISVADGGSFGPGGVRIIADHSGSDIVISGRVRLLRGAEVVGASHLGEGSQIIGAVSARSVVLEAGQDHTWPVADERGAVLKGSGTARGLSLRVGEVVNGLGDFAASPVERQSAYHPAADR